MTSAQLPIDRGAGVAHAMTLARKDMLVQVRDTARAPDACFAAAFGRLVDAIEAIFRTEENLLEMARSDRVRAQRQDNALLLAALHHAAARVDRGNLGIGREVVAVLPDLLSPHRLAALRALATGASRLGHGVGRAPRLARAAAAQQAGEGAR
jgi:hypothetical protein